MTKYPDNTTMTKIERKLATMKIGKSTKSQQSFLARATLYNFLPRELTLIMNNKYFKNHLENYLKDNRRLPDPTKNTKYYHKQQINTQTTPNPCNHQYTTQVIQSPNQQTQPTQTTPNDTQPPQTSTTPPTNTKLCKPTRNPINQHQTF